MSRYAFIATRTERWPVQFLSRVLAVSAAGYYQWRQKSAAVPAPWQAAAQATFTRHARRYGTRRSLAGAPSKPNFCPTALLLSPSKKPA